MLKQLLKKHTRLLFVALCTLVASSNLYADYSFEKNDIYYNINSDGKSVSVTYKDTDTKYEKAVIIPSTVTNDGNTYAVTCIGENAFNNCEDLTSVDIPNSVTSIEKRAFYKSSKLSDINIPNSIISVGSDAFRYTSWLDKQPDGLVYVGSVLYKYQGTMPENTSISIKEGTKVIGIKAFYNCSNLTSIDIPESITNIETYSFYGCTGLTNIHIPNSVTILRERAFYGCTGLTSFDIPESITKIENSVFAYCSKLESIHIPNSVTSMGYDVFEGTSWFDKQPDGVVYAGLIAYKYKGTMPSNTNISFKEGTIVIADRAFRECMELSSINIPNSVTNIGFAAFSYCPKLTSVTIPNSVTDIARGAFFNTGLQEIHVHNTTPPTLGTEVFDAIINCSLYIPINADLNAYKNDAQWGSYSWKNISTENVFELTIEDSGYASVYLPFNAKASDDITAYAATSADYHYLYLQEVTDKLLTKEQGFIVKGNAGKYILSEAEEPFTGTYSILEGVTEEALAPEEYFVLGCENNTIGFYKKNDVYLEPYKVFLFSDGTPIQFLGFNFKGTTTSINQVKSDTKAKIYYDIMGRYIAQPTRGLYIVNGKKIVRK